VTYRGSWIPLRPSHQRHDSGAEMRLTYRRGPTSSPGANTVPHARPEGANESSTARPRPGAHPQDASVIRVVYLQEEWRPLDQLSLLARQLGHHRSCGSKAQPRWPWCTSPSDAVVKPVRPRLPAPVHLRATYADYTTNIPNPALRSEEISRPSCRWCGRSADAWPHRRMPSVAGSRA